MTRKTTKAYVSLFNYIERNICSLRPTSFMTDFELGLRNGLREVYPDATRRNCWFHFKQAIRRKVAKMPLFAQELKSDQNKYRLYQMFQSLPLLPKDDIQATFRLLKQEAMELSEQFAKFVSDYFEPHWMVAVSLKRELQSKLCTIYT